MEETDKVSAFVGILVYLGEPATNKVTKHMYNSLVLSATKEMNKMGNSSSGDPIKINEPGEASLEDRV